MHPSFAEVLEVDRRAVRTSRTASLPLDEGHFYPRAWLLAALAVAFVGFRLHEVLPGIAALKPVFLLSWGGSVLLFANSHAQVRSAVFRDPVFQRFAWLFGWAALTAPFALWPGLAFGTLRSLPYAALLLLFPALCAPSVRNLNRVQFGFVAVGVVFAASGLAWGRNGMEDRLAISGTYDTNDVAALLAATLPLALGFMVRSPKARLPIAGAIAILAMAIVGTASRGGLVALVAGTLVFLGGLGGTRRFIYSLALVFAATAVWSTAPPAFKERMATIFALEEDYNMSASTGRKEIWKRGIGYLADHPVAGVGIGNFPQAEGNHLEQLGIPGKWSAAHNMYVQVFAELGLVGGGIFLAMLLAALRSAARMWRPAAKGLSKTPGFHRPEFLASLLAFSVAALFLSAAYSFALYGFLGLVILADRVRASSTVVPLPSRTAPTRPLGLRGGGWVSNGRNGELVGVPLN